MLRVFLFSSQCSAPFCGSFLFCPLALWLPAPAPGPWLPALNLSPAPGSLLSTPHRPLAPCSQPLTGPWLPALNPSPAPDSLLSTTRLTSENARKRSCERTRERETISVTIRFDSHKLLPDFSGPHRRANFYSPVCFHSLISVLPIISSCLFSLNCPHSSQAI